MSIERVRGRRVAPPSPPPSGDLEKVKTDLAVRKRRAWITGSAWATLARSAAFTDSVITVVDPIGFPAFAVPDATLPFVVAIEDELCEVVGSGSSDWPGQYASDWVVGRGFEGTIIKDHAPATTVYQALLGPAVRESTLLVVTGSYDQYTFWRDTFAKSLNPPHVIHCSDVWSLRGLTKVQGDQVVFFGAPMGNPHLMAVLTELYQGGWLEIQGERVIYEPGVSGVHTFKWDVWNQTWEESDDNRGIHNSYLVNNSGNTMRFNTQPPATLLPGDSINITERYTI